MTQLDAIELLSRYETPLLRDMEQDDDVLEWVAAFIGSDAFQDGIDAFCEQYAAEFTALAGVKRLSEDVLAAHESQWKTLHEQFLTTANASIEAFLTEHGFTMEHYEARCEEEMRLSEERQRHTRLSFFVQILMACCEYDQFLNLMKRAADPEYYQKRELQFEAESILHHQSTNAQQVVSAKAFLDFCQSNPDATLDQLEEEFRRRIQLS